LLIRYVNSSHQTWWQEQKGDGIEPINEISPLPILTLKVNTNTCINIFSAFSGNCIYFFYFTDISRKGIKILNSLFYGDKVFQSDSRQGEHPAPALSQDTPSQPNQPKQDLVDTFDLFKTYLDHKLL
jgi:hypothetical protein